MELRGRLTMKREEAGRILKELGEELLRTGRLTYPSEFGEARDISMPENLYVEVGTRRKGTRRSLR